MEEDNEIIIPPPEMKVICDKTALFVAKNGIGFEDRIREKEFHNLNFTFLSIVDPYHKYYKQKIKEGKDAIAAPAALAAAAAKINNPSKQEQELEPQQQVQQIYQQQTVPGWEYFKNELPTISLLDLEIIKLTAQFTAWNGPGFMSQLGSKESKNIQFDFIRPSHSLYSFYSEMVEQYSKVRNRSRVRSRFTVQNMNGVDNGMRKEKNLIEGLEEDANDRYAILSRISVRSAHALHEITLTQSKKIQADAEKVAFATTDWHDFIVVETIEFLQGDDRDVLGMPLSKETLMGLTIIERKEMLKFGQGSGVFGEIEVDMDEEEEIEMEVDEDEDEVSDLPAPPPSAPPAGNAQPPPPPAPTRTSFVPKVGRHAKSSQTQICTICKASVKMSEMAEHVKMELMDPRYKERRREIEGREVGSNLAEGDAFVQNLTKMAAGEVKDGMAGKVIWDGHQGSIALAQAKMERMQAPPPQPPAPLGPKRTTAAPVNVAKKQKNANALVLTVTVPDSTPIVYDDLTPLWTVSQLKSRIGTSCGMGVGRIKLVKGDGGVLRNSETLGTAGIVSGDVIALMNKK